MKDKDDQPAPLPEESAARLAGYADALDAIIRFHDREVDAELLKGFSDHALAAWLAELTESDTTHEAAAALGHAVADLVPDPPVEALDDLAAEYADLFLTHGYRVAPSGSVWLTEDHIERQLPMFEVREWYEHYDITVPNWRVRADDHLVHELQFVSFLCRRGTDAGAQDAARFLDKHVLPWVPEFCRQALPRLRTPLYRAAFELTLAFLEEVRTALEEITGKEREIHRLQPVTGNRELEEDAAYMPGVAESW